MNESISKLSFARLVSKARLETGNELLDDDLTIWTAAEIIAELSVLPPDTPVLLEVENESGDYDDALFWFQKTVFDDGGIMLALRFVTAE